MIIINTYLIIINILSFIIMAYDKIQAIKGKIRISEHTLFMISLLGGSFGSLLGMLIFKHKIRKLKFIIIIPLLIIIHFFIYKKTPLS